MALRMSSKTKLKQNGRVRNKGNNQTQKTEGYRYVKEISIQIKPIYHINDATNYRKNPDNSNCYHVDPSLDEPMPKWSKRGVKSL